jgi:hypothetical protein
VPWPWSDVPWRGGALATQHRTEEENGRLRSGALLLMVDECEPEHAVVVAALLWRD